MLFFISKDKNEDQISLISLFSVLNIVNGADIGSMCVSENELVVHVYNGQWIKPLMIFLTNEFIMNW